MQMLRDEAAERLAHSRFVEFRQQTIRDEANEVPIEAILPHKEQRLPVDELSQARLFTRPEPRILSAGALCQ